MKIRRRLLILGLILVFVATPINTYLYSTGGGWISLLVIFIGLPVGVWSLVVWYRDRKYFR